MEQTFQPSTDEELDQLEKLARELLDPADGSNSIHAMILRAVARARQGLPSKVVLVSARGWGDDEDVYEPVGVYTSMAKAEEYMAAHHAEQAAEVEVGDELYETDFSTEELPVNGVAP